MKYKLSYLPAFNRDLILAEVNFINFPNKALKLFRSLDKKLTGLADMPMMYPVFEPCPDYRKMVLDDYIVLYAINEAKKTIFLHRLLSGRMNISQRLN